MAGEDTFTSFLRINLDEPVGALSISPSCRDVCLGARKGLFIIDLQSPFDPPRFLPHYAAWDVADVQWNPHTTRANWVVSTSNQKALVWNLEAKRESHVEYWLHSHTRAITDINWSTFEPETLATCSLDGWLALWDLRSSSRPIHRFSDWIASAVQVKFSRFSNHVVASAHEERLVIWDLRMGNRPLNNIVAHDGKIYGIDWSRLRANEILTSGVDGWVKAWDLTKDTESPPSDLTDPQPVHAFKPYTNSPVYRARSLPFGDGVLTISHLGKPEMPSIWTLGQSTRNVDSFSHESAEVDDFVWRFRGGEDAGCDDREFQLITWSKDRKLRLYPVGQDTLRATGHQKGEPIKVRMTGRGVPSSITYRAPPQHPAPVHQDRSLSPSSIRLFTRGKSTVSPLSSSPLAEYSYPSQSQLALTRRTNQSFSIGTGFGFSLPAQTLRAVRNERLIWMEGVDFNGRDESLERLRVSSTLGLRDSSAERSRSESVDVPRQFMMGEEFTELVRCFPRCTFEKMNVKSGFFTVSLYTPLAKGRLSFVRAHFTIPSTYPERGQPTIEIEKSADISQNDRAYLLKNLRKIVGTKAGKKKKSLRDCIEFLVGEDRKMGGRRDWESDSDSGEEGHIKIMRNANVPLPVRCGARFARDGRLISIFPDSLTIMRSTMMARASSISTSRTGRSLSARGKSNDDQSGRLVRGFGVGLFDTGKESEYEDSDEDLKIVDNPIKITNRRFVPGLSERERTSINTKIYLGNVSDVLGSFDKLSPMTNRFVLEGNPKDVCVANVQLAIQCQRFLMAKMWATLATCVSQPDGAPEHQYILGQATEDYLRVMLQYLRKSRDIEALGLFACWLEILRREYYVEENEKHHMSSNESAASADEFPRPITRKRASSMAPIEEEAPKKFSNSSFSLGKNPWANLSGYLFTSKRSESVQSQPPSSEEVDHPGTHHQILTYDREIKTSQSLVQKERLRTPSRASTWSVKSRSPSSGISLGRTINERVPPRTRKLRTIIKVIEYEDHVPPRPFWISLQEQIALEEHRFSYADILHSSMMLEQENKVLRATRSAVEPGYWGADVSEFFLRKLRGIPTSLPSDGQMGSSTSTSASE